MLLLDLLVVYLALSSVSSGLDGVIGHSFKIVLLRGNKDTTRC